MITSKQAKESRLQLGLSQNLIAKSTGLSRPYLSNFEAGKFDPDYQFKETLHAFFIKQGIKFDEVEKEPKKDNTPQNQAKEQEYQESKTIKPIDGILPNLDYVSYGEAQNLMIGVNELNGDLFELSETPLPIKDVGVILENIQIDSEQVNNTMDIMIYRMAKAYLDIMDITGQNIINAVYDKNLPRLCDLENIEDCSINDYILDKLNNIDEIDDLQDDE